MTFAIGPACVDHMDQSCVAVCPTDCIASEEGVDRKFYIDPDGCIECGSCVSVCPNDAIATLETGGPAFRQFVEIDASWYRDRARARALLGAALEPRAA